MFNQNKRRKSIFRLNYFCLKYFLGEEDPRTRKEGLLGMPLGAPAVYKQQARGGASDSVSPRTAPPSGGQSGICRL